MKYDECSYVDADSAAVLRGKAAICAGFAILFRDMCVIADIPCFRLQCALNTKDYFEFDDDGKLAIYRRYRWGEPVKTGMTDENGRYTLENGLIP